MAQSSHRSLGSTTMARSSGAGKVLVVGVGGLGCPATLALAEGGVGHLVLADDDIVEPENLHRQILFSARDCGRDKLDAARAALVERGFPAHRIELFRGRFLPEVALELALEADLVVEGSDNFATKFLAADACHLARRPLVTGAAVRWTATAWAIAPAGRPCYRCLFEDLPDSAPNCATAGVMGPVVGIAGALLADLALRWLDGEEPSGAIHTYDGLSDQLRAVAVTPRADCALCGRSPTITTLTEDRYLDPRCAV